MEVLKNIANNEDYTKKDITLDSKRQDDNYHPTFYYFLLTVELYNFLISPLQIYSINSFISSTE